MADPTGPVAAILRTVKRKRKVDLAAAFTAAVARPGQSAWRLTWRIVRCRFGVQRMTPEEFFSLGLHLPGVTDADCRTRLGDSGATRFNRLLNAEVTEDDRDRSVNKLRAAEVFAAANLPTAKILAVYQAGPGEALGQDLRSADQIAGFLLTPGNTPCFGKPVSGSLSLGIVSVERALAGGQIELGDGRVVAAQDLALEIANHFPDGYIFQTLLRASPDIAHLSGPVVPTMRVYSLWVNGGPKPLYAGLRLPGKGAMSDARSAGRPVRLHIDLTSGAVIRGQDMEEVAGKDALVTPVTGAPLAGEVIPNMPAILALASDVHRQFRRHGCIGADIALSDQGLVVNEANTNALQVNYQLGSGHGLLSDEFRPLFRAALAERGITRPRRGTPWPWI